MTKPDFDYFCAECRATESKYINHPDIPTLELWSRKQAFRAQRIASSIDARIEQRNRNQPLVILNLSGLGSGAIDFPLTRYLKQQGHDVKYFAFDHPKSPFLARDDFLEDTRGCGIKLITGDLKEETSESLFQHIGSKVDFVIFTEIAEHLDHSVWLNALQLISGLLSTDGRLFLSTPNLASLRNRGRLLIGADLDYWGDGTTNMQRGVYGHIVYYTPNRLRRLLADVGLSTTRIQTFDYPWGKAHSHGVPPETMSAGIVRSLISFGERLWRLPKIAMALKTLGETIELEAELGPVKTTPFET